MEKDNQPGKAAGRLQAVNTELLYLAGDNLAKREKYKKLSGLQAVHYYLIQKHNWLPSQVASLKAEELLFCLEEEALYSAA